MIMMHFGGLGLLLTLLGLPLIFLPQWWVKKTYNAFREVPNQKGLTGAQVAQDMLYRANITNVQVESTPGELSDHYDPSARKVRLSPDNYSGRSVAAVTIAAHEVGHAIQHNKGYFPVVLRGHLAPVFGLGSQLGPWVMMAASLLYFGLHAAPAFAFQLGLIGIALFATSVIFHFVTLPVEIDASWRALTILKSSEYLAPAEMPGARKVLIAAAMTYVSVALYSLMQLAYYVMQVMNMRRRD
jgi:uncharacterized protein